MRILRFLADHIHPSECQLFFFFNDPPPPEIYPLPQPAALPISGDGGDAPPAARLDVVAPQPVLRSSKLRAAFDANRRRAGPADPPAEFLQKLTELDYVQIGRAHV